MRQTADGHLEDQGRALIVQVGGDTMAGLAMSLDGTAPHRPLTLDLLWTVRRRAPSIRRCIATTSAASDARRAHNLLQIAEHLTGRLWASPMRHVSQ